jgi:hypothetical protein
MPCLNAEETMSATEHGRRIAELLTVQTICFGRKTSPIRTVRASEECKTGTVPRSTFEAIFVKRPTRAMRLAIVAAVILAPADARPQQIDPEGRTMLGQAQKAVAAYHAGAPRSHSTFRVKHGSTPPSSSHPPAANPAPFDPRGSEHAEIIAISGLIR